MQVLGLVFSLLLILSYGFYACWDKQSASHRISSTYIGHQKVNRKILKSYQSEVYSGCRSSKYTHENPEIEERCKPAKSKAPKPKKPDINRNCAKFNLWPLIQEGREAHPILYDYLIKMIRLFYSPLYEGEKRFEYRFLDQLIKVASLQKETFFSLEKLDLGDPFMQKVYYKMLKGTKKWDIHQGIGYPTILDYIKIENSKDSLCLYHAHPDVFTLFFGPTVAAKVYEEIHKKEGPVLTRELLEKAASEAHKIIDSDIFALVETKATDHEELKKTLIAEDAKTHVILRKNVSLQTN